jgi:glycosyltransferase involved in cell wall biosynthesis
MYSLILRLFTLLFLWLTKIFYLIKKKRKNDDINNLRLLITGKFYSNNWFNAHLQPLSQANNIKTIYLVTDYPMLPIEKVCLIKTPNFLKKILGHSLARLITFTYYGVKLKPDIVGGYHLLLNGLFALFVGTLCGAKTLYNCGGGIREVLGGGYTTENKIFGKLSGPDYIIENNLIESIKLFDYIVVRGVKMQKWLISKGCKNNISIITGGINQLIFHPDIKITQDIDIILSARISEIKRIDIFIETIKILSNSFPELSAFIIGDGPLLSEMKLLAAQMCLNKHIHFLGHQNNVSTYLKRSKIFVLTSDSEGVSLAMIEAMLCGLPVVVSNVGDLGDFVENTVNGYLINSRLAKDFADPIKELLENETKRKSYGNAAYTSACKATLKNIAEKWEKLFEKTEHLAEK